jgi:predicted CXXCH cytochrome family protein
MFKSMAGNSLAVALLLLAARSCLAGTLAGSAHDFTLYNWSGGQLCVACHHPQNTNTSVTVAPQWNHTLSAQSYATYSSPTLKARVGQPGMRSKLCLSCHDGTVAVDSFGGAGGAQYIRSANSIGIALRDDHPIGFVYDTALANLNGTLFDPSSRSVTIGSGGMTQTGSVASLMLFDGGQLECSSCHDVHNQYTSGTTGLMKVDSAGSAICMVCHNK